MNVPRLKPLLHADESWPLNGVESMCWEQKPLQRSGRAQQQNPGGGRAKGVHIVDDSSQNNAAKQGWSKKTHTAAT